MGWTSLSTGPKVNLNFLNLRTIFFYEKDKFNSLPYVSLCEKVKGAFLPA